MPVTPRTRTVVRALGPPRGCDNLDHEPSKSMSVSISPRSTRLSSISVRKRLGMVKTVGPRPPRLMVSG